MYFGGIYSSSHSSETWDGPCEDCWGQEEHVLLEDLRAISVAGAAWERARDVRLDRKTGARLCRQDKEAGFTQSAVGRHWWALQRVEGDFPKLSTPCCSRILLSTGVNHSLIRRLLGTMPSVTRDPTTYILHRIGNKTNSGESTLENI